MMEGEAGLKWGLATAREHAALQGHRKVGDSDRRSPREGTGEWDERGRTARLGRIGAEGAARTICTPLLIHP